MGEARQFSLCARAFIDVVGRIRPEQWAQQGLGVWDVRGLVGHASRAILTVENYLEADEPGTVSIADAVSYYTELAGQFTDDGIAERGVEAGAWLGDHPVAVLREALERTEALIAEQPPLRIISIGGMGIPFQQYLRTRVLELVVHTLDICEATGISHKLPETAISDTAALASRIAVARGHGREVLFALTGRGELPSGFSIV